MDTEIDHFLNYLAAVVNGDKPGDPVERPALAQFLAATTQAYQTFRNQRQQAHNDRKAAFWDALTEPRDRLENEDASMQVITLLARYHAGLPPEGPDGQG